MRRIARISGSLSALWLMLLVVPLRSATAEWRLDLQGGALAASSSVKLRDAEESVDIDVDSAPSYAIGGGYSLNQNLDLAGHFQHSLSGLSFRLFGADLDIYSATLGGRYSLLEPESRFRPFLISEMGYYRASGSFRRGIFFSRTISSTDDGFGINVGGGFDFRLNRRVSLGLDLRYHHAFDVLNDLDYLTTMLNVGVHFGN